MDSLLSRRVDGIVVAGRRSDPRPPISRQELPVPVVYAMTQSSAAGDISLVPDDVALVGFDNWDVMALAARPPLTSVDMNLDGLGRAAGQELLSMLDGHRRTGVLRLPCELVVRGSTGGEEEPEEAHA